MSEREVREAGNVGDRVRFAIGTAKVWQGYHVKGESGMVGAEVYVTADTLRQIVEHVDADIHTDFDRIHNPMDFENDALAFGAEPWWESPQGTRVAPDGKTVLYPLATFEATIVQRYDPNGGKAYQRVSEDGTTSVPYGVWVNEDTIDSFHGGIDGIVPEPQGFVADAALWAEGRSDTPPIETEASREAREHPVKVARILIEYTNGAEASMDFDTVESNQSGTSYSGEVPEQGRALEENISEAVTNGNLWPESR